ncbi:MAG: HEAT repeat domain-containing protein [Phycisphaerae bacterium]|nr:HEAT repeat domain-containing protein [Phycisphaerae bacterium]
MIRFAGSQFMSRGARVAAVLAAALALAGCMPDRETTLRRLREDNPRVQVNTIYQVVRADDRTLVPELITLLESEDEGVRFFAASALHKLTGRDFGFHRARSSAERERIIGQWRAWWESEGGGAPADASGKATADTPKARGT